MNEDTIIPEAEVVAISPVTELLEEPKEESLEWCKACIETQLDGAQNLYETCADDGSQCHTVTEADAQKIIDLEEHAESLVNELGKSSPGVHQEFKSKIEALARDLNECARTHSVCDTARFAVKVGELKHLADETMAMNERASRVSRFSPTMRFDQTLEDKDLKC